jgi:hypothetical protein
MFLFFIFFILNEGDRPPSHRGETDPPISNEMERSRLVHIGGVIWSFYFVGPFYPS